jgi:molybdopterin biosynthesis enzyme
MPFPALDAVISSGSLSLASEDSLYDIISKVTKTHSEMLCFLELA